MCVGALRAAAWSCFARLRLGLQHCSLGARAMVALSSCAAQVHVS